jgi:hypothetical protein
MFNIINFKKLSEVFGGLINLIELNATEEDFFDYLWEVETKHIGMPGNRENTTTHAKKIKNLTK